MANKGDDGDEKGFLRNIIEEEGTKNSGILMNYLHGIGGAVSSVKNVAEVDLWPDVDKIDDLVRVWTLVGYGAGTACVLATAYLGLRTTREIAQWRVWLRRSPRRN